MSAAASCRSTAAPCARCERASVIDAALGLLACPHCTSPLSQEEGSLACRQGHRFDIARQGHVNLLGRAAPQNADTAEMVAARARFLAAGHYEPIATALARRVSGARRIVEVGAGTGWYLGRLLDAAPQAVGLATDVSPMAARRAARAHERAGSVVADTWAGLPVRAGVADVLSCVFAPRNAAEFTRITAQGGLLLVVTPNAGHLLQAREALGLLGLEADKLAKVQRQFAGAFEPIGTQRVTWRMDLSAESLADLVAMGPNAFHEHEPVREGMRVDADVQVSIFRKPVHRG